jgi:hypothetical protein
MIELEFRLIYQHEETGYIQERYILLGELIPEINRYRLIAKNQYIGYHDKNGKKLYLGDILKVPYGWSGDYEEKEHLAEIFNDDEDGIGFYYSRPDDVSIRDCEKVGDIYNNPTMIEYEKAIKELNRQYPTKKE